VLAAISQVGDLRFRDQLLDALCGMLHAIGLLREDNEALIPYAIRLLKGKQFDIAPRFKKTFSRSSLCQPRFLGVWDTVSSVGWVYNGVQFPYTKATLQLDTVRAAIDIFGEGNVRFFGGGIPTVFLEGCRATEGALERLLDWSSMP